MPDPFVALEDQDVDSRVVLDYTSRDFTAIRSQLVGLAKGLMPEWETAGEPSDFGTLLLELFAYMGDVLHFYIDRTASEAFLGTALRQQSVLYIANMMGYTPIGQSAAIVKMEFELDQNAVDKITIPVGTRVHNTTSNADEMVVFEMDTEVVLDPTVDPKILTGTGYATEGIIKREHFLGTGQGAPMTTFMIPDKGVVFNSVSLKTREGGQIVDWALIANLALARPTQPVFTLFRDEQDYTHVVFGDNASGRVPPVNAQIFVTYRYGKGAEANLIQPNKIKTIINSTDEEWWGLSISNPRSPVGGTDPETVDAMRQSVPRAAARIKNRAITLNDYADLALQVPNVAKSVAHGTVYTAVTVRIAPSEGQGDDNYMKTLCDQVEFYMKDKVIIGSTVYAEPEKIEELWYDFQIRMMVHVQTGYNRTTVRLAVDSTIRAVLDFDSVDFGTRISIGQMYRAALAVQGVEWVDLLWLDDEPPADADMESDIETDDDQRVIKDIDPGALLIPRITPNILKAAKATAKVLTSNVVTLTVVAPHTFVVGDWVEVTDMGTSFNGKYPLTAVTPTSLSYAKTHANVASEVDTGTVTQYAPPEDELPHWEGLTEEERTHDGLWVKAVGGLIGT